MRYFNAHTQREREIKQISVSITFHPSMAGWTELNETEQNRAEENKEEKRTVSRIRPGTAYLGMISFAPANERTVIRHDMPCHTTQCNEIILY